MSACIRTRPRAFTLIELLVVISIIALLVSILLPALARAREETKSLRCLANHKQLTFAALSYADDNRGYMPFFYGTYSPLFKPFFYRASPFWTYMQPRVFDPSSSSTWDLTPFHCPMIDNGAYNNAPYYYAGGIGGNMPPFYYDLDGNPNNKPHYLRRVQDVKKASTFDVFADNRGAIVTYYNDIDFRHGLKRWILGQNNIGLNTGYANAAYVDGHGGRTRYADIYFWDGVKRGPKYFLFYWDGDVP